MKVAELFEAKIDKPFGNAQYKPGYDSGTGHLRGSTRDWLKMADITLDEVKLALDQIKETPLFKKELPAAGLIYQPTPRKEKNGTLYFKVRRRVKGEDEYGLEDFKRIPSVFDPSGKLKLSAKTPKDKLLIAILKTLKNGGNSQAQNMINASRKEGIDYPEFRDIEKSIRTQPVNISKVKWYNGYYVVHANGQIRTMSQSGFGSNSRTKLKSSKPRLIPGDHVKSLVKTYTQALEQMLSIWKKSKERQAPSHPNIHSYASAEE